MGLTDRLNALSADRDRLLNDVAVCYTAKCEAEAEVERLRKMCVRQAKQLVATQSKVVRMRADALNANAVADDAIKRLSASEAEVERLKWMLDAAAEDSHGMDLRETAPEYMADLARRWEEEHRDGA